MNTNMCNIGEKKNTIIGLWTIQNFKVPKSSNQTLIKHMIFESSLYSATHEICNKDKLRDQMNKTQQQAWADIR